VSRLLVRLGARGIARIRGGWRRGRYAAAFVTVALAGALAACGDSVPAVGLSGPGTPLAGGLVVPPGTRLIGPVFPSPTLVGGDKRGFTALLAVEGDPFAAWDHLASQARSLGAPLPSSGKCSWLDLVTEQGALLHPELVHQPRPDGAEAMACDGSSYGPTPGGGSISVTARLWWRAEGAELGFEISVGEGEYSRSRTYGTAGGDPGPAPASAAAELPVRDVPVVPEVGEPFGLETECFGYYARLRVPPGARVVGGGSAPVLSGFAVVLAVNDPEAVLEHIADQLDPTGPDVGEGSLTIQQVDLPDGSVWLLAEGGAHSGSCRMWSSPDGRAVLVIA
jgi:hypothetical protein